MPHFGIDHNFPVQATGLPWPSAIRLTRLVEVDSRLIAGYDDWEVFLELGRRGGVDGFMYAFTA